MADLSLTRRRFLLATGWVAAGVTAVVLGGRRVLTQLPSVGPPGEEGGAAWLQILPDGRCLMRSPRAEMGQHASLGLAQLAAEELNLPVEAIEVRQPGTDEIGRVMLTSGSMSLRLFGAPMARAAAALRETLRTRAAQRAGVAVTEVADSDGGFMLANGRAIGYAELAGGEAVVLDEGAFPEAALYSFDPKRIHRQIGRRAAPHALESVVTGAPLFAADVRLPNMLFGRAVRPPVIHARLAEIDDSALAGIRGFVRLVVDAAEGFVGVVCETPGAVAAALARLQVRWEIPAPFDQAAVDALLDVDAALARGRLEHVAHEDVLEATAPWDVDLRFDVQMQSHAMAEPRAAVARFEGEDAQGRLELWTGSQDPFVVQRHAAEDLGLVAARVVVHPCRMGGGFGGREHYDVERDAARLARAVGRPVKVQWTREDEFRSARHRPGSSHRVRLRLDEQGRITDWWHAFVSGHIVFARERLPGWLLGSIRWLGDLGVARGSEPPYAISRRRVEYADLDLPVDLGTWRSLGASPNTFATESALDELARKRGLDPVELRLRNLPPEHARLAECLRRVRVLAERVPLPTGPGVGRGFACGIYDEQSFVAASADVRVDPASGAISVLRMCCAQDVGLAVNPDQLEAQIEGNLIWGLGMALHEQVVLGASEVASLNFDRYAIPRISDAPSIEIALIDRRDLPPAGAGETAMIVAAPAIANALRDATGRRFTRLPILSAARP